MARSPFFACKDKAYDCTVQANIMDRLRHIVSSKARAEIFRLLFGLPSAPLHLREIQRQSGLAASTIQAELRHLAALELVAARVDGNRTYFAANRAHPLFPDIQGLVLKTAGLVDVLREALRNPQIQFAFVFGSVAAGNEKAASDVDLMVLGSIGLRKLSALLSGASERLGREINPHVLTVPDFKARLAGKEHFVSRVWQSDRLFAIGTEHELSAVVAK